MDDGDDSRWYAVRCLFRTQGTPKFTPPDLGEDETAYEERITLWQAADVDEAIAKAEAEAADYADLVGSEHLSFFAQAYHLADVPPRDGSEVFSLIRYSDLPPDPYADRFFDTGTERQQR